MASHKRFIRGADWLRTKEPAIPFAVTNKIFERCFEQYLSARLQLRYAPLVGSLRIDERKRPVNRFALVEFSVDFENVVKAAIGEDIGLTADFRQYLKQRLDLAEEPLPEKQRQILAHRIGAVCVKRNLEPLQYFRRAR